MRTSILYYIVLYQTSTYIELYRNIIQSQKIGHLIQQINLTEKYVTSRSIIQPGSR
jgi:hypothetical protein